MADLQKLPVNAGEVIGKGGVFVTPTIVERVPSRNSTFEPYRVFTVSGDIQQDVQVRVGGLENSDIPKSSGLQKVELTGLTMVVQNVQSRGKTKREIAFTAKSLRLVK